MEWEEIRKTPGSLHVTPNLVDYTEACLHASWGAERERLDGNPLGAPLNIAHLAVDRHAAGPLRDHVAIRWLGRDQVRDLTYGDLADESSRFANVLRSLGVGRGDAVFVLTGRVPELYIAAMGTLKNGSVFAPLFSAFGPEPIRQRLTLGNARVLLTTSFHYRKKVQQLRTALPHLEHVILLDGDVPIEGTRDYHALMSAAAPDFDAVDTAAEDRALLHFTSGTTGTPKGAIHVHQAAVSHYATARYALDLHPHDVFWCTADPGWVTGTSYGIIAPLLHGLTSIVDEADFDLERWYSILQDQHVTVWYTAPTAMRMLMRAGAEIPQRYDLSSLRFIASVGEPLNPEAVVWGQGAFGLPVHDNWWQTETGGIMIANFAASDIRPGSMGRPLPGVEAACLRCDDEGELVDVDGHVEVVPDGQEGQLALRPGWPSMFRGYLDMPERYAGAFRDGWYLTGDMARRDADGYFWFLGRGDDVIKAQGHLIGPFEVESVLMAHPAVVEAGVIGKPDPVAKQVVKAFVTLRPGYEPSEELRLELLGFARKQLGGAIAPREIAFEQHLPHTRSGKVMRRLLRARELGLPEGDLSTLEVPA